jgi:4-hydroxy-tetrahydrodipicolinate synthase
MPAAPSTLSAGVFPVAPTAFTDDGEVDLAGQRRILDCMRDCSNSPARPPRWR